MRLLERETHLEALHQVAAEAAGGRGRMVLVTGEAGIGKTSLVEKFTRETEARTRVLWGACEALFTPRPLGPFYDIVHSLGGPLRTLLDAESKQIDLFHGLLDAVRRDDRSTVIVLEDVHLADNATLDFIRFLARRIEKLPAMLVMTLRDDEVGADHPLTAVLGELPPSGRLRLKLPALSRATVEELAREAGRPAADLFRITGGNPFFVDEVLREDAGGIAMSVREAVLSRAQRLSEAARELLDLTSIVPDRIDLAVLEQMPSTGLEALGECIDRGLLILEHARVGYRHELARLAIESALPAVKRMRLNRRMLELLANAGDDPDTLTRLAHYAIAAADAAAIIRHVPRAARLASQRGGHREAAALLAEVLPHAQRMSPEERAAFLEQRAQACFLIDQGGEAVAMSEAAYNEWSALRDDLAMGRNLVQRCQMVWLVHSPQFPDLRNLAREAIGLIERVGSTDDLALAYSAVALAAGIGEASAAAASHTKALEFGRQSGSADVRVGVLIRITLSEHQSSGAPSVESIDRLMQEARGSGDDQGVMAAYLASAIRCYRSRDLDGLERCVADGLAFAQDRQLDRFIITYLLERFAGEAAAARGDWRAAEQNFESIAKRAGAPLWMRLCHLQAQVALSRCRQGQPFDRACFDEAFDGEEALFRTDIYALHRANAEIAWLQGDGAEARRSARVISRIAASWDHPWVRGEAAFWRRMSGDPDGLSDGNAAPMPEPYARLFAGDWRGAAEAWRHRGYRYEEGLALMMGDEDGQREALRAFEALGATSAAERVRERMRDQGIQGIPLGPRASTKTHPAGLTARETEILELLAEGLSNADIAGRLHRSTRTVEHHVATLTEKLGADSRLEAVAVARRRGFLSN